MTPQEPLQILAQSRSRASSEEELEGPPCADDMQGLSSGQIKPQGHPGSHAPAEEEFEADSQTLRAVADALQNEAQGQGGEGADQEACKRQRTQARDDQRLCGRLQGETGALFAAQQLFVMVLC